MRFKAALILLAVAWMPPSNVGAAEPSAHPEWTSDQVRAARPTGLEDALVFDLRVETRNGDGSSRVETSTVELTPSFTYVEAGPNRALDDYALCRTFTWSNAVTGFQNASCYAQPAFVTFELANRLRLQAILSHAGPTATVDPASVAPYWGETELSAQAAAGTPLVMAQTPDGREYRLQGRPVVQAAGAAGQLGPDERQRFARFLARHVHLHPQVRRDLAAEGLLPARLEVETRLVSKPGREVILISNLRRAKFAYPLPAELAADLVVPGQADATLVRALQQVVPAIEGRPTTPKPSLDDLRAALRDAAARHRPVEVALRFLQLAQQYPTALSGPDHAASVAEIGPLIRAAAQDPAAARLLQVQALAGSATAAGDREAAARYLAGARELDSLPFGAFRYVTFANLARVSPGAAKWDPAIFKAMPSPLVANFWTAIAAYPWASGPYKDAGDTYLQGFDAGHAWLAYDLGRAIDPDWRSGSMSYLARFEQQLRSTQPDFF